MRALIAFDLDGVLYSSEPFLGEAYREAIANVNVQRPGSFSRVPPTREILDHVGWPLSEMLERMFPAVEVAALDLLYAEALAVICAHVRRGEGLLFPGIAETLDRLRAAGFTLVIASNGRQAYIDAVLEANGIGSYFAPLLAIDRVRMKVKADLLRGYLARYEAPVERLVMIGDRASDVEAAAAVGSRFIGCDYGHGYQHEIDGAGPIVSAFDQLLEVIARVLS